MGLDMAKADPVVRRAFAAAGPNGGGYRSGQFELDGPRTLRIVAHAAVGAVTRIAVIRVPEHENDPGNSYWLQDWSEG